MKKKHCLIAHSMILTTYDFRKRPTALTDMTFKKYGQRNIRLCVITKLIK